MSRPEAVELPVAADTAGALVEVDHVSVHYQRPRTLLGGNPPIRALDDVTLAIPVGGALGIVGETGSGKSTFAQVVMGMIRPTTGTVRYRGQDINALSPRALRAHRRRVQVVLQDPYSSLNPRMSVRDIVAEPMTLRGREPRRVRDQRIRGLLEVVGLSATKLGAYPHEFSGGQRQRIAIARALAGDPELIILDEPTSALDVSIRAQVLNLLRTIKKELTVTYVVISHDLSGVAYLSTEVAVLHAGRVVEHGTTEQVYTAPAHPYTELLLASSPSADPADADDVLAAVPPARPPDGPRPDDGCHYAAGCVLRTRLGGPARCTTERPALVADDHGHAAACHFRAAAGADTEGEMPHGSSPEA